MSVRTGSSSELIRDLFVSMSFCGFRSEIGWNKYRFESRVDQSHTWMIVILIKANKDENWMDWIDIVLQCIF